MNVQTQADRESVGRKGAEIFSTLATRGAAERGYFRVALSGGQSPVPIYQALAKNPASLDWGRTQVFFSDERFVAPDSSRSNSNSATQNLLSKVPILPRAVHRMATMDITPDESAGLYEQGIWRVFEIAPGQLPHFDLIMLGLGADGHTASLFPDTAALEDTDALVAANYVPELNSWRITFTYPTINAARVVMFVVTGHDKAPVVAKVIGGDQALPAARIRPDGELIWLLDEAAASQLPKNPGAST
ncbi:MAG: 6-phosphogluconolactonase [Chloroflexota bacterium]